MSDTPLPAVRVTDRKSIGLACADCVPRVHGSTCSTMDGGAARVLSVEHDATCPGWRRMVSAGLVVDGVAAATDRGVLVVETCAGDTE